MSGLVDVSETISREYLADSTITTTERRVIKTLLYEFDIPIRSTHSVVIITRLAARDDR
jgi:hypothetical protein